MAIATNLLEMSRLRDAHDLRGHRGGGQRRRPGHRGDRPDTDAGELRLLRGVARGSAAILWKDSGQAPKAAEAMRITAFDLWDMGIVDEVVPEPPGGAHIDPQATARGCRRLSPAISELRSTYGAGHDLRTALLEDRLHDSAASGCSASHPLVRSPAVASVATRRCHPAGVRQPRAHPPPLL